MASANDKEGNWDIDCDPRKEKCASKYAEVTWEECANPPRSIFNDQKCDLIKAKPVWQRYINARFGAAADVPPGFMSLVSPGNGDGRTFVHPDGSELLVYGSGNNWGSRSGKRYSVKQVFEKELSDLASEKKKVIHKELKDNWFVVAYEDKKDIYYIRQFVSKDLIRVIRFKFPKSLKRNYLPIVDRVSYSFSYVKSMYSQIPYNSQTKTSRPKQMKSF